LSPASLGFSAHLDLSLTFEKFSGLGSLQVSSPPLSSGVPLESFLRLLPRCPLPVPHRGVLNLPFQFDPGHSPLSSSPVLTSGAVFCFFFFHISSLTRVLSPLPSRRFFISAPLCQLPFSVLVLCFFIVNLCLFFYSPLSS